jgi:type II secretory pathway component GspD/PulD (secretin)
MRKTIFILAAVLLAGFTFAQKSESVEGILKELSDYKAQPQPAAAPEAEAAVMPAAEMPAMSAPAAVKPAAKAAAKTVEEAPAVDIDIPAVLEDSREAYAGGEFERAQAGFEAVIKIAPENIVARMYLRKLIERDHRRTEVSGLKAVTSAWDTSLVLRSYAISADALERMELGEMNGPVDVTAKFPEVDFPQGASAMYQPRMEKLFARNTIENLTVLEEILDAMDVAKTASDVEQVEIEAKFIEVAEGTLEDLGFEWNFQNSMNSGIQGDDISYNDGTGLFSDALRGGSGETLPFSKPSNLSSSAFPGASVISAGTQAGLNEDWTTFRFEDTFSSTASSLLLENNGSNPVDILISALDQSSGSDMLSAPRIVTKSGEEATIRVGQLHNFPEVYEPSASGGNIVHVKYEDWEEKLLGVELKVTPQVDGDQIEMELNPKITELQGWQSYEVAPKDSAYTWYQFRIGLKFYHEAIEAKLPIFSVRNIETEVTIADGGTIAMGGLVNDRIESYEDKVPVLGSLPLVGRLFRSEGERAVKRNLMMFVTAKKIEPTGRVNSTRSFQ